MYLDVKRDTGDHEEVEFLLEAYLADIQDCMNKAKGSGFLTVVIRLFSYVLNFSFLTFPDFSYVFFYL